MMADWGAAYKPRDDEEDRLQIAVAGHVEARLSPNAIAYHCPNGGKRSIKVAQKLKRMGVLAGVADWCLVLPDGSAAYLELKSKDGVLSLGQKEFKARCELIGVPYVVSRNLDHALMTLEAWGVIRGY